MQPQSPTSFAESSSGLIERVTFHNEDTGFAVLKVKAKGHRDLVTVVGSLASVGSGMVLKNLIDSGVVPVVRLTEVFRQCTPSVAHRVVLHAMIQPLRVSRWQRRFKFTNKF